MDGTHIARKGKSFVFSLIYFVGTWFSQVDLPEHLANLPFDKLQFTLVDCPGHASLIKTIIGGKLL
jgi:translation elongation factor EF-1alpha